LVFGAFRLGARTPPLKGQNNPHQGAVGGVMSKEVCREQQFCYPYSIAGILATYGSHGRQ
jgi:hypothetical protein